MARAAKSAMKRGMLARAVVADSENKDDFARLARKLRAEFAPETPLEEVVLAQMTAAAWRLQREWRQQAEYAGCEDEVQISSKREGGLMRTFFRCLNTLKQLQTLRAGARNVPARGSGAVRTGTAMPADLAAILPRNTEKSAKTGPLEGP